MSVDIVSGARVAEHLQNTTKLRKTLSKIKSTRSLRLLADWAVLHSLNSNLSAQALEHAREQRRDERKRSLKYRVKREMRGRGYVLVHHGWGKRAWVRRQERHNDAVHEYLENMEETTEHFPGGTPKLVLDDETGRVTAWMACLPVAVPVTDSSTSD